MSQQPATGSDRAGWRQQLLPGRRPALLLVDMVNAYFSPGGVFELPPNGALDAASTLLRAARDHSKMVVHTRVEYAPGCADGGVFVEKVAGLKVFEKGVDPFAGTHAEPVAPASDELVLTKQMPSAFFGTALAGALASRSIDTIVIGGVSTSGCVRASAVDAMSFGLRVFVAADACADRSVDIHQNNLNDLQDKYAEVVSIADATAILDDSGRDG